MFAYKTNNTLLKEKPLKKKNLQPKLSTPVVRATIGSNLNSLEKFLGRGNGVSGGVGASIELETDWVIWKNGRPFAGDDAE